jgi:hypothetical protein
MALRHYLLYVPRATGVACTFRPAIRRCHYASEPGEQRHQSIAAASLRRTPCASCIRLQALVDSSPIWAEAIEPFFTGAWFRSLSVPTAASRTPPWLGSGWGCRGRHISRDDKGGMSYCGSPIFSTNSANRGSERNGSSRKSVFKLSIPTSRS